MCTPQRSHVFFTFSCDTVWWILLAFENYCRKVTDCSVSFCIHFQLSSIGYDFQKSLLFISVGDVFSLEEGVLVFVLSKKGKKTLNSKNTVCHSRSLFLFVVCSSSVALHHWQLSLHPVDGISWSTNNVYKSHPWFWCLSGILDIII